MLQFNVEAGAWTKIGSLQKGRHDHAIAEVNLAALGCVGNLNPVKKKTKSLISFLQKSAMLNVQRADLL